MLLITNLFPNPVEPNRGIFIANMVKEMRDRPIFTIYFADTVVSEMAHPETV